MLSLKNSNAGLEEKVNSLLDTLYGCEECGRHGDFCECGNDVDEPDDPVEGDYEATVPHSDSSTYTNPPSASTPSWTSILPHLPPPSSSSTPWTPPATPPCSSCGGKNYGACPDNICFGCIPPLEARL